MVGDTLMIPQIELGTENWTAVVTVVEDMPTMTGTKIGSKYKRYVLVDAEGNEMLAIAFGNAIGPMTKILKQFSVFKISNAQVRLASPDYQVIGKNDLQWVLQRSTLVRPMPLEPPNLSTLAQDIVPFNELPDKLPKPEEPKDKDVIVDVMAIVIASTDPKSTDSRYGPGTVQRFTFVDMHKQAIPFSLWDQLVHTVGPILEKAASSYSVVLAKRVKVQEYKGVVLGSRNFSSFTVDPPLPQAAELKSWFDSVREIELPHLVSNYSIIFAKDLVDRGIIPVHNVQEIITSEECKDYWTRAFMQVSLDNQKLYYIACSNCFAKVDYHEGIDYQCALCDKHVISMPRLIVTMDIFDDTGRVAAGGIDLVAEEILQTTATDLLRLNKSGLKYELDSIRAQLENKKFLILLRRTYSRKAGGARRLLLVSFFDDSTAAGNVSGCLNTPTEPALRISPLKRQSQMDSVTINIGNEGSPLKKKLTFDEASENVYGETSKAAISGATDSATIGSSTSSVEK